MRIYVAGALTTLAPGVEDTRTPSTVVIEYIQNMTKMFRVAGVLRKMGFTPYVPAWDLLCGLVNGNWNEEEYRGIGLDFMEVCDAVLVISDSRGVQREVKCANELGIPVYHSLGEILDG